MEKTFQNPLLSGFYPDPSVCRVGEDYYLVTSSFCYFPGIPVFHSRDLVHWEQLGHVLTRKEQLDYRNCDVSEGVWAPTIRYHQGTFYVINTFCTQGREGKRENYICTAKNPAGPWSDAVIIQGADGIDPSLLFDEGKMWYVGNFICDPCLFEGHHGLYLCELDPVTFQFKGERKVLWDGQTSLDRWLEAPHIYHIGDWYYLLAAEGGTFTNHSVVMARSRRVDGEYEICRRNPILTHRHLSLESEIAVTGHAELFNTQNGEWWMALLAVRPYEGFHYNLGRETFLVPMTWGEDGWPRVDNADGLVHPVERLPNLPVTPYPVPSRCDNFEEETLGLCWNTLRQSGAPFHSLRERPGFLRLYARPQRITERCTPAFLGRRQQHKYFSARTAMEFFPQREGDEAGLALHQNERYLYSFTVLKKADGLYLRLLQVRGEGETLLREEKIPGAKRLYLTAEGKNDRYGFYYGFSEREQLPFVEEADGRVLSTPEADGFVGAYLGLYCSANGGESGGYADFDWFLYEPV